MGKKSLTIKATGKGIYSVVSIQIDCCRSFYYGLPEYQVEKLQHVQHAAARLITGSCKYEGITPILTPGPQSMTLCSVVCTLSIVNITFTN